MIVLIIQSLDLKEILLMPAFGVWVILMVGIGYGGATLEGVGGGGDGNEGGFGGPGGPGGGGGGGGGGDCGG